MRTWTLLAAATLVGCTSQPTLIDRPVEVKVPVQVPCSFEIPKKPDFKMDRHGVAVASPFDQLTFVLEDLESYRGYVKELEGVLSVCGASSN